MSEARDRSRSPPAMRPQCVCVCHAPLRDQADRLFSVFFPDVPMFHNPSQEVKDQFHASDESSEGDGPLTQCACSLCGEGQAYIRQCDIWVPASHLENGLCHFCRPATPRVCKPNMPVVLELTSKAIPYYKRRHWQQ